MELVILSVTSESDTMNRLNTQIPSGRTGCNEVLKNRDAVYGISLLCLVFLRWLAGWLAGEIDG